MKQRNDNCRQHDDRQEGQRSNYRPGISRSRFDYIKNVTDFVSLLGWAKRLFPLPLEMLETANLFAPRTSRGRGMQCD